MTECLWNWRESDLIPTGRYAISWFLQKIGLVLKCVLNPTVRKDRVEGKEARKEEIRSPKTSPNWGYFGRRRNKYPKSIQVQGWEPISTPRWNFRALGFTLWSQSNSWAVMIMFKFCMCIDVRPMQSDFVAGTVQCQSISWTMALTEFPKKSRKPGIYLVHQ